VIGRESEKNCLRRALEKKEAQLVAVYGRRRVGKTYLVRQTFGDRFYFSHAGLAKGSMAEQLGSFRDSLVRAGAKDVPTLRNWREAFNALRDFIEAGDRRTKKVVFVDEMPWMDTPKSKFVMWFEAFWNGWCSGRKDVVFVICGSATSWIVKKVFRNRGGLYDRVTEQIYLRPFTLSECRAMAQGRQLGYTDADIAELYMVFGGIPYYWDFLERGKSVAQNIDALAFSAVGKLRKEFDDVYSSLFGDNPGYLKIVRALAARPCGMTFNEILAKTGLSMGSGALRLLDALEQSDFVRRFTSFGKKKRDAQYQLIDNFSLFYLRFLDGERNPDPHFWQHATIGSELNAWRGFAFERVCLLHVPQIKKALGVSGVLTRVFSWRHVPTERHPDGAQVDLVIERADRIVNLCEIKFAQKPYVVTKAYDQKLRFRAAIFSEVTNSRYAPHTTLITTYGVSRASCLGAFQSEVTLKDLFAEAEK